MNVMLPSKGPLRSRYSVRSLTKSMHFYHAHCDARFLNLVGVLNGWDSNAHRMFRRLYRWRSIEVPLSHGHPHYLFLVDGVPTLDPNADGTGQCEIFPKRSATAVS